MYFNKNFTSLTLTKYAAAKMLLILKDEKNFFTIQRVYISIFLTLLGQKTFVCSARFHWAKADKPNF